MSILDALFLGLLQGLSEFLPISSSGHLFLVGRLNILSGEVSLLFAVMLHLGSLAAVIVVFWDKVKYAIVHPFSNLTKNIVLASIPTAILAGLAWYFLNDVLEGALLPLGFFLTTIFLIITAFLHPKSNTLSPSNALLIGLAQGFAVLPGLSRSGSTIATAQMCGADRQDAGEFSFLISIPIIIGSALVEGRELTKSALSTSLLPIIIGVVVSFVSGYFALIALKGIIKQAKLHYFAPYTFVLGILTLFI